MRLRPEGLETRVGFVTVFRFQFYKCVMTDGLQQLIDVLPASFGGIETEDATPRAR